MFTHVIALALVVLAVVVVLLLYSNSVHTNSGRVVAVSMSPVAATVRVVAVSMSVVAATDEVLCTGFTTCGSLLWLKSVGYLCLEYNMYCIHMYIRVQSY
jgi:hypothetical protein